VCIGNHFALMEIELIASMIVRRYLLRVAPGVKVKPDVLITLTPKGGLPYATQILDTSDICKEDIIIPWATTHDT
jgi:hypothetical protein